jgi:hypothetical protein
MGRIKELTFLRFAHFCTAIAGGGSTLDSGYPSSHPWSIVEPFHGKSVAILLWSDIMRKESKPKEGGQWLNGLSTSIILWQGFL